MSMENATPTGKDTIYIDVDEEITGLIDKVRSSHARIVALVLPKRATVLQSVVNMKLLKHSAEVAKKHLVLITSEASLMPLAGSVGLYVAKTLQSKPEIPDAPEVPGREVESLEEALHLDDEEPMAAKTAAVKASASSAASAGGKEASKGDAHKAVSELAKGTIADASIDEALELDDQLDDVSAAAPAKAKKEKGAKKLRIPDFNKFRVLLVVGVLAIIALIVLFIVCTKVLPKATITIKTNRQAVNITPTFTVDTAAKAVNTANSTIPAQSQQTSKTYTGQVSTTGQQNNGTKATGTVSMSDGACTGNQPNSILAGTGISTNNLTYILNDTVVFNPVIVHGKCTFQGQDTTTGNSTIGITAQGAGTSYNTSGNSVTFTISGRSDVSVSGSASGGTDNIIQIVAPADITSAEAKIGTPDTTSIKQQLEDSLKSAGSFPLTATFSASTPVVTTSAQAGAQASTVTATEQVTYTMLGAKQNDLQQIVKASVGQQVNTSKQGIVDYGLSGASFTQQSATTTAVTLSMQDTAVVGADLNTNTIRSEVAGKKTPAATSLIQSNPGVTSVTIKYSPFWVMSIPKNTSKITVQIEKPQAASNGQ